MPTRVDANFEKPFQKSLKDKSWLTELVDGLTNFSKLQEGFKEIARYVKQNKDDLNDKRQFFYDEIEMIRIKYEYGRKAANKYQESCDNVDESFMRKFIDSNISFQNDFDSS